MATTKYCVYVEEPKFEDPEAPLYYTITIRPTRLGGHECDISAITEAAKSLSHCEILHIAAGFRDGILFNHDSICEFLELYAPMPKLALTWLDHARGITVRPTFEQIHAMG